MPPPLALRTNALKQNLKTGALNSSAAPCSLLYKTPILLAQNHAQKLSLSRSFSSSRTSYRNASKPTKGVSIWETASLQAQRKGQSKSEPEAVVDDPFDFSALEASIHKSIDRLGNDLGKLRTGGRFNPEVLENVRVTLQKGAKETIRLGELAQVLPKGGRNIMVLIGEKDHVKPIISAIQGSKDLNLQPQQDPHNPLQLNVPIPPPTKESRDAALVAATAAGEAAKVGVQHARAANQKRLRGMELKKIVRPDDLKKAHKEMEKLVEKGITDVKKTVETARKHMEQS